MITYVTNLLVLFEEWRNNKEQCDKFEKYTDIYIAMTRTELEQLLFKAWRDGYIKGCDR